MENKMGTTIIYCGNHLLKFDSFLLSLIQLSYTLRELFVIWKITLLQSYLNMARDVP